MNIFFEQKKRYFNIGILRLCKINTVETLKILSLWYLPK